MPLIFFLDAAVITIDWYIAWAGVCYYTPMYCPVG